MNDHDLDLILDLAEGRLTGADAEAALARIAADPELADELALQRIAVEALSDVPDVAMTARERTELRSRLRNQLDLVDPEPAVVPSAGRRRSWWQPMLGLASAAAVVLVVVAVVPNLGGSDSGDDVAFVEENSVTTTAASGGADAADGGGSESSPTAEESIPELEDFDGGALLDITEGKTSTDDIEESLERAVQPRAFSSVTRDEVEACLEQRADELPEGEIIPLGTETTNGEELVYLGFIGLDGLQVVVTVDVETCEITDVDR